MESEDKSTTTIETVKKIPMKIITYKGKDKEIPMKNEDEGKCEKFIIAKMRYCHFDKYNNGEYCVYHMTNNDNTFLQCPYDTKHRILASKFKKHLKTCNTLAQKNHLQTSPWFSKDINKASNDFTTDQQSELQKYNEMKWDDLSNEDFESIIDKIISSYDKMKDIYSTYITENHLEDFLSKFNQSSNEDDKEDKEIEYSLSGISINKEKDLQSTKQLINSEKHGKQNKAITKLLYRSGMIDNKSLEESKGCLVIEFGAGKGGLSLAINKESNDKTINLMLERQGMRYKKEKHCSNMFRYRTDIIDFNMKYINDNIDKFPIPKETQQFLINKGYDIIGVAKHICGCAFDLSLTCVFNYSPMERVKALCMATCCHHISRIELLNHLSIYTNTLNLSIKEIVFLFKATSWIFGKIDPNNKDLSKEKDMMTKEHNSIFTKKQIEKSYIGLISKYIVDLTRTMCLVHKGFRVFYLKYCDNDLTTENNLILAINQPK